MALHERKKSDTIKKKELQEMIAYCGLDCSKCECYLATQANNNKKRKEVAEKWTFQYGTEIQPEQINCNGCKSDGIKFFFTENGCDIRKCNIEKSIPYCSVCNEYKCEKLEKFIVLAPPVGEALASLRQNQK